MGAPNRLWPVFLRLTVVASLVFIVFHLSQMMIDFYSYPITVRTDSGSHHSKTNAQSEELRYPDVLVIGVPKCGSTALMWFLPLHPRFRTINGELNFLSDDKNYQKGLGYYLSLMPKVSRDDVLFERDGTCWRKNYQERVRKTYDKINRNVKLVLVVCEPVNRVVSWYTNSLAHDPSLRPIESYIIDNKTGEVNANYDGVRAAVYDRYFPLWLNFFPRNKIHIVNGDKLKTDPVSELRKFENFMQVENKITDRQVYFNKTKGFFCKRLTDGTSVCMGGNKGRPHPKVKDVAIRKLHEYFAPHNKHFEKMVDQKFNW